MCVFAVGRIKPLRINAYVDESVVQACISGIRKPVVERFVPRMLACERYFADDTDFRAWLTETGEKSTSFASGRLEFS